MVEEHERSGGMIRHHLQRGGAWCEPWQPKLFETSDYRPIAGAGFRVAYSANGR
jgi:hypothetical protein